YRGQVFVVGEYIDGHIYANSLPARVFNSCAQVPAAEIVRLASQAEHGTAKIYSISPIMDCRLHFLEIACRGEQFRPFQNYILSLHFSTAFLASWSQRSFSQWPLCPLIHIQSISWGPHALSSLSQRSLLSTSFF